MAGIRSIADSLRDAARRAEETGRTADADELFRLAFELETELKHRASPARDAALAKLARDAGDTATAAMLAERAPDPLLSGILAVEALDLVGARKLLAGVREANPFDAQAAAWLGELNFLERKFDAALANFLEAEWLSPNGTGPAAARHLRALCGLLGLDPPRVEREVGAARARLEEAASASGIDFPGADRTAAIAERLAGRRDPAAPDALERSTRMRALPAFEAMPERSIFDLASIALARPVPGGQPVYSTGEAAASFFLVISGRVALERATPVGPQALGRFAPGEFFGAAEPLTGRPRYSDAVAIEEALLWEFPMVRQERRGFAVLLSELQVQLARQLRSLNDEFKTFFSSSERADTITEPARPGQGALADDEKAKLLSQGGLSRADLALFAAFASEQSYSQGDVIFREGDPGNTLYVIAQGSVRISRRIPGAGEEALAILDRGAVFGEMSIFDPTPAGRSADAIAHENCTLLCLERRVVDDLRAVGPEASSDLISLLCRVAARRILETSEKLVHWRVMAGQF